MNLRNFLRNLFSNRTLNGEMQAARTAGEHDAEVMVGAYLDGFESQMARMLTERKSRLIGIAHDHGNAPEVIDGELADVPTIDVEPEAVTKPARKPVAAKVTRRKPTKPVKTTAKR